MSTKLIQTKDYLLLVDEEAEIKDKDILYNEIFGVYESEANGAVKSHYKIMAYYPLTKEAKELDLPLLPPFEEEINIEILALKNLNKTNKIFDSIGRPDLKSNLDYENGYLDGAKFGVTQSHSKQFIFTQQELEELLLRTIRYPKYFGDDIPQEKVKKIIQSLSTQQLPKEFVTEYEIDYIYKPSGTQQRDGGFYGFNKLKTTTNSEGKQELIGNYKY